MKAESSTSPPATNGAHSETSTAARFIRPHLQRLAPYKPIEPFEILSAKYGSISSDLHHVMHDLHLPLDANMNSAGLHPSSEEFFSLLARRRTQSFMI